MTDDPTLSNAGGAYALHALEPVEAQAFEDRMRDDDELRAEVTSLADTAVELGLAVTPEDPGAALRSRVLDAVAGLPQLPAETTEVEEPSLPAPVDLASHRRFRRSVRAISIAAAAAVLAVGGVALGNAVTQNQHHSVVASRIDQIQSAPDVARTTTAVTGGGTATVIWSAELKRSALIVRGLPSPAAGRTYELWYINGHTATPAGTFTPTADGSRSIVLTGMLHTGDTIGLTVEPAGGSPAPTTSPVLAVSTT